jgi:two-component system cell cycle response regulator CpdR
LRDLERFLRMTKPRRLIDSTAVPAQHWRRPQSLPAFRLHPKFTIHRAKWVDRCSDPDSTPPAMHKILLAEDDNDMRRFLVKALENAGFQVSPHDNGLSAYQRLREEPFEMLLTDIVMPEMDGIELARRATELDPDIKIMFITGFAAVALNSDSDAPKNAKVLSKPVHLRELVSEVNKMLAA